jgi:hypothetical protein
MPLKSDPRRLPRRNHYQEGPDFLFVATQGGRPMAAEPVRSPAAVVRGRARTIRLWAEGTSISEACTAGRCSRATLFRWRERFFSPPPTPRGPTSLGGSPGSVGSDHRRCTASASPSPTSVAITGGFMPIQGCRQHPRARLSTSRSDRPRT